MNIFSFPTSAPSLFFILDVEYISDLQLYGRYRRADPKPASLRWPFRRVASASVMAVSINEGIWEVTDFRSFTGPSDRKIVRELFDWILERPAHRAVTWSGAAEDLPILKTASMEFGFTLPLQLRQNERDRAGFCHLDLCLLLKAGSGTHVHQLELATRFQLPGKMAGSAGQVPHLLSEGRYEACGWISEVDILMTSLLLASHLATLGQVMSAKAAHFVSMKYVRDRRERASYHRELGNYLAKIEREMMADQQRWLEAC